MEEEENIYVPEVAKKVFFVYLLQVFVKDCLERHPREVSLRLIYIMLLKDSLNNNFKAVFELLNCQEMHPNLQQKFEIFRIISEVEAKFESQARLESASGKNQLIDV
jgi:hypothetical protein